MSLSEVSVWVPSPASNRGQATKLSASADGTKIAYGSGRSAVIRSLVDGSSIMFGHPTNCTVANISPSGFYCASGDAAGNIKVWDTTGSGSVKLESKPISKVNDVAWDGESKRLVIVGEGREKFGATFSLDTGASIGEISGHSKPINCVAMKTSRPFRAVTGSDDSTVCVSNGVPFKFASQSRKHSRFVQSVDYSPSGALFVSAGSDGSLFLYDGATGADVATSFVDPTVGSAAHKGTIFQASFSKDSSQIVTSSADQTVKLWGVSSGKLLQTWDFTGSAASSLLSQQIGNTFLTAKTLVTLSFSGLLTILDINSTTPVKQISGHQSSITSLYLSPADGSIITGDSSGAVRKFGKSGVCETVGNGGHTNLVVAIVGSGDGEVWSTAYDDTIKKISGDAYSSTALSTTTLPKGLSIVSSTGTLFLATNNSVQAFSTKSNSKQGSISVSFSPTSIAASPDGKLVAVGAEENACFIYDGSLKEVTKLEGRNQVTAVAFSGDSSKLAVGFSDGKIFLFDASTLTLIHSRFTFHSARISTLAFNADSTLLASGSLDESVRVYSLAETSKVLAAKNVHRGGVAALAWKGSNEIVSGGSDGAVKTLKLDA